MTNLFSIGIPFDQALKRKLEKLIVKLSKSYKGPLFEPHITLLANIAEEQDRFIELTKQLALQLRPFPLLLGEVSFSTTYFQSVFVRIRANSELMEANLLAKKLFNAKNNIFMPHASLLYGEQDMKTREKITKEIKLPHLRFIANSIVVTPSTQDPKDWVHLAEFNFPN